MTHKYRQTKTATLRRSPEQPLRHLITPILPSMTHRIVYLYTFKSIARNETNILYEQTDLFLDNRNAGAFHMAVRPGFSNLGSIAGWANRGRIHAHPKGPACLPGGP